MALTPELTKLKGELETLGFRNRTVGQDRMLAELEAIDGTLVRKNLEEAAFESLTKMTSPGGGGCPCCGK